VFGLGIQSPASPSAGPSSSDGSKQAVDRAEVRPITFHELRHTFCTRMTAAGVPLRTIQHWMGHADAKITQIYAHYQPSEAEADVLDAALA